MMKRQHPSISMIEIVAKALGNYLDEVVFIGGSTLPFYFDDEGSQEPRPTEDVDCVVELVNYYDYIQFESKLRKLGFINSTRKNDPICRWVIQNTIVDIIPTESNILGFSNRWYKDGILHAIKINLPSELEIKIFSPLYFILSKIEAFLSRGQNDFRTSKDFEDIVMLLDGLNDKSSIINPMGSPIQLTILMNIFNRSS